MTWNAARSEARIRKHLTMVPAVEDGVTLAKHVAMQLEARARGDLGELSTRRTFLVEGAHLYGQLLDFNDLVAEQGRETESSHARVLRFLNTYYRVWDSIVDNEDGYRVDYHGARLHAVVTEPAGDPRGQVERAVALASKLADAAKQVGDAYGFPARIRFGIDHGRCLAMTTGRSHEKDTLFLGAPANHAAKKAAEAEVPGVFLADGAMRVVGSQALAKSLSGEMYLTESYTRDATSHYRFDRIDRAVAVLVEEHRKGVAEPVFRFRRQTPPLSSLKFAELSPAKSVRMGMASLFADIDGFTAYVDAAIRGGPLQIKAAVKTIHVIREELNDVLQDDFGGKRVRFIGDCIHGCLAAGVNTDDPATAVDDTAMCAAGMRSSFDLCLRLAQPAANLDLAIGIEYGPVPVTRLGTPGNDSVRCAAGRAVIDAERIQQSIVGGGVKMGPTALSHARSAVRKHFGEAARIISYASAADLLGTVSSPAVQVIRENPAARPHASTRN
jgi:class 3 adenylate cyclase